LKPVCLPQADGGRMGSAASRARKARCNYVRMIKPNLIDSHNWHVQPNCQRSLRVIRLSGTLLDRGPALRPACPRTCCAPPIAFNRIHRRFCANLSNISNFRSPVKPIHPSDDSFSPAPRSRLLHISVVSLLAVDPCSRIRSDWRGARPGKPAQKPRTAQNIKQPPRANRAEPLRLTGVSPITQEVLLGLAMACSGLFGLALCGIPYSGSGAFSLI